MKRIFFDTEFYDDGRTIDLISVGLVAVEDRGRIADLYLEVEGFDWSRVQQDDDFLVREVRPRLRGGDCLRPREEVARRIAAWVGRGEVEFWGYVCAYDWVALLQLYGPLMARPSTWPTTALDLKQSLRSCGRKADEVIPRDPGAHDALADAHWNARLHRTMQVSLSPVFP